MTTVAMESTGVYWIPVFEILERRGLKPRLVDARHMKNVPGRRTDWQECQWLQYLHAASKTNRAIVLLTSCTGRHPKLQFAPIRVQHLLVST